MKLRGFFFLVVFAFGCSDPYEFRNRDLRPVVGLLDEETYYRVVSNSELYGNGVFLIDTVGRDVVFAILRENRTSLDSASYRKRFVDSIAKNVMKFSFTNNSTGILSHYWDIVNLHFHLYDAVSHGRQYSFYYVPDDRIFW